MLQLRLRPGPKAVARGLKVLDANTRALAQLIANFMQIAARRGSPPADVQPMLQRFYASLLDGTPLPASAEDGLRVVQMLRSIWPAPRPS